MLPSRGALGGWSHLALGGPGAAGPASGWLTPRAWLRAAAPLGHLLGSSAQPVCRRWQHCQEQRIWDTEPPLKQKCVSHSCHLSTRSGTNTPEPDPLPTSRPGDSKRNKAWSLPKEFMAKVKGRKIHAKGVDGAWSSTQATEGLRMLLGGEHTLQSGEGHAS